MTGAADRIGLGALLLLVLSSCILIVPDPPADIGATCRLTDDERETDCGACVAEQCQEELAACCAVGDACVPWIHDLVACELYESCKEAGDSDEERALRNCRARRCVADCTLMGETGEVEEEPEADAGRDAGRDAGASGGGRVCVTEGDACGCTIKAGESSKGTCDPGSGDETYRCCANTTYPQSGGCACYPVECERSGDFCECRDRYETLPTYDDNSSCVGAEGPCCSNGVTCTCDSSVSECESGFEKVGTCVASALGCPANTKKVQSCD